jgi:hypothetical protein
MRARLYRQGAHPVDRMNSALRGTSLGVLAGMLVLLFGCAGRSADPVMVYRYDDETRSCDALDQELGQIQAEIEALMPGTDKTDRNTALGVTGIFLVVPLFFMDLSKAEQVEVNALTKRYNHLVDIGSRKDCAFERQAIPDFRKTDY